MIRRFLYHVTFWVICLCAISLPVACIRSSEETPPQKKGPGKVTYLKETSQKYNQPSAALDALSPQKATEAERGPMHKAWNELQNKSQATFKYAINGQSREMNTLHASALFIRDPKEIKIGDIQNIFSDYFELKDVISECAVFLLCLALNKNLSDGDKKLLSKKLIVELGKRPKSEANKKIIGLQALENILKLSRCYKQIAEYDDSVDNRIEGCKYIIEHWLEEDDLNNSTHRHPRKEIEGNILHVMSYIIPDNAPLADKETLKEFIKLKKVRNLLRRENKKRELPWEVYQTADTREIFFKTIMSNIKEEGENPHALTGNNMTLSAPPAGLWEDKHKTMEENFFNRIWRYIQGDKGYAKEVQEAYKKCSGKEITRKEKDTKTGKSVTRTEYSEGLKIFGPGDQIPGKLQCIPIKD